MESRIVTGIVFHCLQCVELITLSPCVECLARKYSKSLLWDIEVDNFLSLKNHLHGGSDRKALDALSRHGCQCNFLDWVANFRPVESEIPYEELLMCPMLWCREKFNSIASTVDHVGDCRLLYNAWYWCPYCKRPERFLKCDKGCELVKEPRLRRKNSGLHKAISFFNYFGRRRSWRIAAGV